MNYVMSAIPEYRTGHQHYDKYLEGYPTSHTPEFRSLEKQAHKRLNEEEEDAVVLVQKEN